MDKPVLEVPVMLGHLMNTPEVPVIRVGWPMLPGPGRYELHEEDEMEG